MEEKLLKSKLICNKASNNGIFGSVELFNFINSPDFEEIFKTANLLTNNGGKPDIILTRLIEEKGFNALPVLVDKHHYSLLLSSKLTRIYRGVVYKDAIEDFAYKVLEYLWADVSKFDRSKWFVDGIKSLDDLVNKYKTNGLEVFINDVFKK